MQPPNWADLSVQAKSWPSPGAKRCETNPHKVFFDKSPQKYVLWVNIPRKIRLRPLQRQALVRVAGGQAQLGQNPIESTAHSVCNPRYYSSSKKHPQMRFPCCHHERHSCRSIRHIVSTTPSCTMTQKRHNRDRSFKSNSFSNNKS